MDRKDFLASLGIITGGAVSGLGLKFDLENSVSPGNLNPGSSEFWELIRENFSFPPGYVYLNTGGIGSVPRHVRSLVSDAWFQLETNPTPGHDSGKWNSLKKDVALLMGDKVDASEIALVSSATEGINIILNGLPLQKGDEVITSLHEHPALNIPLLNLVKRKGIVLRTFEPDTADGLNNIRRIGELMTKKTRLLFISHRTTTTGQLFPVKELGELCRTRSVWFALDGAQAPGSMPVDVKGWNADFYTFSSHKWILAPRRTGVLYVSKDKQDIVAPVTVGAYSDNGYNIKDGTLNFQDSAQRYEYGTQNELLYMGFHASLKYVTGIGIPVIREHNEELSEKFRDELVSLGVPEILSPAQREYRSSMITFRLPGKSLNDISGSMGKDNIRVRPVGEAGLNGIRISFHLYNNQNDLDKAVESIKKIIKS